MESRLKKLGKPNRNFLIVGAAALALLIMLIAIIASVSSGKKENDEWGKSPLAEGVPAFSDHPDSVLASERSIAAFYSNVSSEEIADYVAKLKDVCGIDLSGTGWPRSAKYEERLIALHYNMTERNFSVTITQQEE